MGLGQLVVEGLGPDESLGAILAELGLTGRVPVRVEDRGYVFPDFELEKPEEYEGPAWRMERLKEVFPQEAGGLQDGQSDSGRQAGRVESRRRAIITRSRWTSLVSRSGAQSVRRL